MSDNRSSLNLQPPFSTNSGDGNLCVDHRTRSRLTMIRILYKEFFRSLKVTSNIATSADALAMRCLLSVT